ncbi:retrovirus-related pol polyprotein from transposon TNT 1-94 [Tanacetum coccineum]
MTTIRVVLAMCATYDLHLEQLDVKTAFLHGNLEEEIYMLQPEGFKQKGKENLVCRLHADPCAYFKRFRNDDFIILLLYVDDMLVAGPNKDRINKLKAQLAREFEMKDLGPANKILGMQIHRDRVSRKIWLSQNSQKCYVMTITCKVKREDRDVSSYRMIGIGKFNVCNDLYKNRHCTCSRSSELVHEKLVDKLWNAVILTEVNQPPEVLNHWTSHSAVAEKLNLVVVNGNRICLNLPWHFYASIPVRIELQVAGSKFGTKFVDIDLSGGDFSEYCEENKVPVMISNLRSEFRVVDMTKRIV